MKIKCSSGLFLSKRGFTLIELLVVVLIIGILAAVALPQYNKAVKKAQGAELLTAVDAMDKALAVFYQTYGNYEPNNQSIINSSDLDIEIPVLKNWKYGNMGEHDTSTTFIQLGCGNPHDKYDYIYSIPPGISVYMNWENGRLTEISCQEFSGANGRKCTDYFNCEWQDIPWAPCSTCDPVRVDTKCFIK